MSLNDRIRAFADPARAIDRESPYQAEGFIPTPPDALAELGSGNSVALREVVPELGSLRSAIVTYKRMTSNDAGVDVALRATKAPVLGAEFYIEPYDGADENLEIADFIRYNLFDGMRVPWLVVLEEVLRSFDYGFSILEKVYEQREWVPDRKGANRRKYTMLRKLSPRPASTIKEFIYDDNGGPVEVIQNAMDADKNTKEIKIPIEKLIIFTLNREGGNLEGKSILRTAYKHWYYKDNLYKIDAIQKERHGIGVPKVEMPPGYTEADLAAALTMVRNLRTNEEAGIVQLPGYVVSFAKPEGELVDVMKSIEHHNAMIMLNVMAEFMIMGMHATGGGGRATSGSQFDMFMKSLRYVANSICDHINMYLVPQLVAYNYTTDKFPRLSVRNIGESKDLQMWAAAMANLAAQGLITPDMETEQWIRKVIDAPIKLEPRPTEELEHSPNGKGDVSTSRPEDNSGNLGKAPTES